MHNLLLLFMQYPVSKLKIKEERERVSRLTWSGCVEHQEPNQSACMHALPCELLERFKS